MSEQENRPREEQGEPLPEGSASPEEPAGEAPGGAEEAPAPKGKKPWYRRPGIVAGIAAAVFLLIGLAGWLVTRSYPQEPAVGPVEPPAASDGAWSFPSYDTMNLLTVDDFYLLTDGTIRISYGEGAAAPGLSEGYLENRLSFDPPTEFTVEREDDRSFIIHVEGGRELHDTRMLLSHSNSDFNFEAVVDARFAGRVSLGEKATGVPIEGPVFVEFSDEIDPADAGRLLLRRGDLPEEAETVPCEASAEGNLVKLAPGQMLEYDSGYLVELPAGLTSKNGEALAGGQTLPLRTEPRDFSLIMTNRGVNTVRPDEEISLEYQLDTVAKKGREATVELFRLSDIDAYTALLLDPAAGAAGAEPVGEPQAVRMKEGLNEVSLPGPGRGYYAVRTTVTDTKTKEPVEEWKALQAATASLYMQSAQRQMLLWLNDSATGGSLANHTVRFTQDGAQVASATTGADGSAVFPFTPPAYEDGEAEEAYHGKGMPPVKPVLFTIYDPAGSAVYADVTRGMTAETAYYGESFGRKKDRYYAFFYLDRALYRPTDTVRFWGYLKPYRMNRGAMPSTVTVTLDPGGLGEQVQAAVRADGTFSGELPFEQIVSSDYAVQAEIPCTPYTDEYSGEVVSARVLDTVYIDVKEFTTPAYQIDSSVDGLIYRYGDEVTATITPTFYDGTPLPDYPLEFSLFNPYSGNFEAVRTVTTDARGVARVTFKAGEAVTEGKTSWTPRRGYYYVKIAHDGENVTYQGTYTYVPANVMLRPSVRFGADGNAELTVLANRIDLSRVTSQTQVDDLIGGYYDYNDSYDHKYDVLVGEPVDMRLNLHAYCDSYDADETYQSHGIAEMLPVTAGKGIRKAMFEQEFWTPQYYAHVSADISYSANGSELVASASANNGKPWPGDKDAEREALKGYTFDIYKNGGSKPAQQYEQYLARSFVEADAGDTLRFELRHNGAPVNDPDGRMLYTYIQDEIIYRGDAVDRFTIKAGQQHANSVLVVAAYFDGKDVHAVSNAFLGIKNESMALTVDASTDREAYRPGGEVTVSAKVTDRNGKPVSGNLLVSVVDEAIFSLREQYFDVLDELYGELNFYTYYVYKYTTTDGDLNPFNQSGDGGKGDGDSLAVYDSFRKNFKDTAAFYPLRSDQNGAASVTFTLPDNITSWRITSIAIGDNLYAGSSKTNFAVTLPFFVKPVLSPEYIAGDEVSMLIQGHGTALGEGDGVSYEVRLAGDGVDRSFTAQGKAYESVQIDFGELPEGEYTVTSTGRFGQMRDTVELPLTVIHSNLELLVSKELDLNQPIDLGVKRYPVVITLYDEAYAPFYDSVSALLTRYSYRTDQRAARYVAKRALAESADSLPRYVQADGAELSAFQNADGGVGWYAGSQSDAELTLGLLLAAPEPFSAKRMRNYFAQVSTDPNVDPVDRAAAHAGLAALEPAHAAKIREILSNDHLPFLEQLYYITGLAAAGEQQEAEQLYEGLVVPKQRAHGEEKWLEFSTLSKVYDRESENRRGSELALLTASVLKLEDDADAYSRYFGRKGGWGNQLLSQTVYVARYDRTVPTPVSFSYTSGGQAHPVSLGVAGRKTLTFRRSELEGLAFQDAPASVRAVAHYVGEPEEAGMAPSEHIKVQKDLIAMEGGKYKVTLTLDFEDAASYGYYSVSDWIPSSMRLHTVARQPQSNQFWISHSQENQKLYFEFYRDEHTPARVLIEYYVQQTYDSKAVLDRTYLVCADSGENAATGRSSVGG